MRFEEYVIFNPPIYDKEWWSYTKPLLEEYKRKAELWDGVVEVLPIAKHLLDKDQVMRLMREILSDSNNGDDKQMKEKCAEYGEKIKDFIDSLTQTTTEKPE